MQTDGQKLGAMSNATSHSKGRIIRHVTTTVESVYRDVFRTES